MSELLALAILGCWMWREAAHRRDLNAVLERYTGANLVPPAAAVPALYEAGSDEDEWAIEQARLAAGDWEQD